MAAQSLATGRRRVQERFEDKTPVVGRRFYLSSSGMLFARPYETQVVSKDLEPQDDVSSLQPVTPRSAEKVSISFLVSSFYKRWPEDVVAAGVVDADVAKLPCHELELIRDGDGSTSRRLFVDAATVQLAEKEDMWPEDKTPEEDFAAS